MPNEHDLVSVGWASGGVRVPATLHDRCPGRRGVGISNEQAARAAPCVVFLSSYAEREHTRSERLTAELHEADEGGVWCLNVVLARAAACVVLRGTDYR